MDRRTLQAALFGKHPSSSEYLYLNVHSDFMNSVSKWVEKGYEALLQSRVTQKSSKVHHFCFFNRQEESMICGSMKISQDRRGRKYPLVIAVEVSPYSSFVNRQEAIDFSKKISQKIIKIFQKECDLEALKHELQQLSRSEFLSATVESPMSSLFMNEDFSESKLFYRPLEINDFITTME